MESFPSDGFEKLEWLDVSKNSISNLPDMTSWGNIKSFWALKNRITEVQSSFCKETLDTVNLSDNEISRRRFLFQKII